MLGGWYVELWASDFSSENEPWGVSENAIDDSVLRDITENNSRQTVREIAFQMKVSYSTITRRLAPIGMQRKWQMGSAWVKRYTEAQMNGDSHIAMPKK